MNVSMTQLLQEMNLSSIDQAHDYCMSFGIDPKKNRTGDSAHSLR